MKIFVEICDEIMLKLKSNVSIIKNIKLHKMQLINMYFNQKKFFQEFILITFQNKNKKSNRGEDNIKVFMQFKI